MTDAQIASSVTPRQVEWLWRERIPAGMLTIVAGKPDQGKGLFVSHLAADVSKRGGNVLYSAQEDAMDLMTRPRLEAAGADLDRVLLWRFRVPEAQRELESIVVDREIRLVIIDPMAAHLSGGISRHSDNVREVLQPVAELAESTGCAFVIVEHALKRIAANAHPLASIGGSGSGLPAAARMAYVFGKDPNDGDRCVLAPVKSNLRDTPKALAFEADSEELDIVGEIPLLVVQGETDFDPMRLLVAKGEPAKRGRPADKRAAANEWLTMYLANQGGPTPVGQVMEDAKQYGLSSKTTRRAAEDMGVVKNPPGGGRNCTWDLPADVKKAIAASKVGGGS